MRDHPGPGPAQHDRAEVMIGMMVGQHEPADRLARDGADRAHQLLPLRGAPERIDHHDAVAGNDEAGVWSPFRAATCVTEHDVDAGGHLADGKLLRAEGRDYERRYTQT